MSVLAPPGPDVNDAYYFGCGTDVGHFWWHSFGGGPKIWNRPAGCPWSYEVDGGAQPDRGRPEGLCALHRKDGWTLIGWWDCTVDRRPGSCSAFTLKGDHDFAEMVAALRELFPWVVARMRFELRLAAGDGS